MLKYFIFLTLVLVIYSSHSLALGLGEPELRSNLNNPLNIHLPILSSEKLLPEEIKVKIASQKMHEKYGIVRSYSQPPLLLSVSTESEAEPYITLYTREAFKEPWFRVLVELRWPRGTVYKELTVLLQLPE